MGVDNLGGFKNKNIKPANNISVKPSCQMKAAFTPESTRYAVVGAPNAPAAVISGNEIPLIAP